MDRLTTSRWSSLRVKTLLSIGIALTVLILVLSLPLRTIVLRSFDQIEAQSVLANMDRVQNALDQQFHHMDDTAAAWGVWDDTYEFVQQPNQEYIDTNISVDTFAQYNTQVMAFVNMSGQVVFSRYVDPESGAFAEVPPAFLSQIGAGSIWTRHESTDTTHSGLMSLPDGPMLVVSRPIVTGLGEGPIRGTAVMGRWLNQTELQDLSALTQLPIEAYQLDNPQLPADVSTVQADLIEQSVIVQPQSADAITGYLLVKDALGDPAVVLRVQTPRPIHQQGVASINYSTIALLLAGVVFGTIIILVLEKLVVSRVTRLVANVTSIGASDDQAARVATGGRDEIAQLGGAINGMLARIEQAQTEQQHAQAHTLQMQQEIIDMQAATLAAHATPLIPITDQIVVMPLIGTVDQRRAEQIQQALLQGVATQRARIAIIDITGIPSFNGTVATSLVHMAQAVRLLGAEVVLTGIRADVARALVALDVDLRQITTTGTLQDGIAQAQTLLHTTSRSTSSL